MKYATYGQVATRIGKDGKNLIYSVVPFGQYESESVENVLITFSNNLNEMIKNGKDRLKIEVKTKKLDDCFVMCAEYIPRDETAKIARVVFD